MFYRRSDWGPMVIRQYVRLNRISCFEFSKVFQHWRELFEWQNRKKVPLNTVTRRRNPKCQPPEFCYQMCTPKGTPIKLSLDGLHSKFRRRVIRAMGQHSSIWYSGNESSHCLRFHKHYVMINWAPPKLSLFLQSDTFSFCFHGICYACKLHVCFRYLNTELEWRDLSLWSIEKSDIFCY